MFGTLGARLFCEIDFLHQFCMEWLTYKFFSIRFLYKFNLQKVKVYTPISGFRNSILGFTCMLLKVFH